MPVPQNVRQLGNRSACHILIEHQDDPRQQRPDISKAQELLDWIPTIALKGPGRVIGLKHLESHLIKLHGTHATLGRLLVSRAGSYSDRIGARN